LPDPDRGGTLEQLFEFLNVGDKGDRLLVLAWLVAVAFKDVSRPILLFQGTQGSAKTTSARVLRKLVDPSRTEVMGPPRTSEELLHQPRETCRSGVRQSLADAGLDG